MAEPAPERTLLTCSQIGTPHDRHWLHGSHHGYECPGEPEPAPERRELPATMLEPCSFDDTPAPERTPPDDTSEGLRERLTKVVTRWALMYPLGNYGIWGTAGASRDQLAGIAEDIAGGWGREIAERVLAELAGDPGDLPARMATGLREAIDYELTTGDESGLRELLASLDDPSSSALVTAAMSVRWEDNARTKAELAAYVTAAQSTDIEGDARDHFADLADWETPNGETPEWLVDAVMGFVAPHVCAASAAEHARDQAEAEVERLRAELAGARDIAGWAEAERDLLRETLAESDLGAQVLAQWEAIAAADADRDRLEAELDVLKAAAGAALEAPHSRLTARMLRAALATHETTPNAPTSITDDHGRTWDPHPFAQSRAVDNVRVCICGRPADHRIHDPEVGDDWRKQITDASLAAAREKFGPEFGETAPDGKEGSDGA